MLVLVVVAAGAAFVLLASAAFVLLSRKTPLVSGVFAAIGIVVAALAAVALVTWRLWG